MMKEYEKEEVELKISGMSCAMCAKTIEKSLLSLNGVIGARVNLGNETAFVEYDSKKLRMIDLEKAIKDAGYGALFGGKSKGENFRSDKKIDEFTAQNSYCY